MRKMKNEMEAVRLTGFCEVSDRVLLGDYILAAPREEIMIAAGIFTRTFGSDDMVHI